MRPGWGSTYTPDGSRARALVALSAATLALVLGFFLMVDRPGLQVTYFALDPQFSQPATFSEVGTPSVASAEDLEGRLVSIRLFGMRWQGWIEIDEPGSYRFRARAGGDLRVSLDGEPLMEVENRPGRRQRRAVEELDRGLHALDLELAQRNERIVVALEWEPPGGDWQPIPVEHLFVHRPGPLQRRLRRLGGGLEPRARSLLGALLVAVGLAVLPLRGMGGRNRIAALIRQASGGISRLAGSSSAQLVFVAGAVVAVAWVCLPFTGSTADGDDVRYLYAAAFAKKMGWIVNRYVHVHLLRGFMSLSEGDAFLGSRTYWSVLFGTTIGAMAFATRALGRGLQLRTLAVALVVLSSQAAVLSAIGAAYADYSAMLFVTLGVAAYVDSRFPRPVEDPRWHGLAIGVFTLAAIKSKETGIILLWLPLLFLWGSEDIDLRRFVRFAVHCVAGGLLAYALLMACDAQVLGDAWFSLRPETLSGLARLKGASEGMSKWDSMVWLQVVWSGVPRFAPSHFALRHLGLLVVFAAALSFARSQPWDVRLLHLMPVVYLAMMIAIHPAYFSSRFLIPIIPVSCLLGAMALYHLGLESVSWRRVASPRFVVPLSLVTACVLWVVAPFRFEAEPLWPGAGEWIESRTLLAAVSVAAALVLIGVMIWCRKRYLRILVALLCVVGFFGPGAVGNWQNLERKLAVQRSALILYPWTAFNEELESARPRQLTLAPSIVREYRMTGQRITRNRLARVHFRRVHLKVATSRSFQPDLEVLIGDRNDLRSWRSTARPFDARVVSDPSGQLRLVQPAR